MCDLLKANPTLGILSSADPFFFISLLFWLDFFASGKNVAGIERTIEQTTEVIRARAEWTKKDGTAVGRWLLAHYGSVVDQY